MNTLKKLYFLILILFGQILPINQTTNDDEEPISDFLEKFVVQVTNKSNNSESLVEKSTEDIYETIKDQLEDLSEDTKKFIEIKLNFHALVQRIINSLKIKKSAQQDLKDFFATLESICKNKRAIALSNVLKLCQAFVAGTNDILLEQKIRRKKVAKLEQLADDFIKRIIIELEKNFLISSALSSIPPFAKDKLPSKKELIFHLEKFKKALKDLPLHVKVMNLFQEYTKTSTTIGVTIITLLLTYSVYRSTRANHIDQVVQSVKDIGKTAANIGTLLSTELPPTNRQLQNTLSSLSLESLTGLAQKINALDISTRLEKYATELQKTEISSGAQLKILSGLKFDLTELEKAHPYLAAKTDPILNGVKTLEKQLQTPSSSDAATKNRQTQELSTHIQALKDFTQNLPNNIADFLGLPPEKILPSLLSEITNPPNPN